MDSLIKRNGRRSTDVLLYALKAGYPVWPVTVSHSREETSRGFMAVVESACTNEEKSILLLSLDTEHIDQHAYLTDLARMALVERCIGGVSLPENVSVFVYAEEGDFPGLFSDPAISAVAKPLERWIQDPKRQLGDPINYVPSWRGEAAADALTP